MARREYVLWGGATFEHELEVVVIRGTTTFTIRVQFSRIAETRFGKEYLLQLKDSMRRDLHEARDITSSKEPTTLLLSHCMPLLKTLAPEISIPGLTVADLCHCPVYSLGLVGSAADPREVQIEGAEHVSYYAPAYDISPIPMTDLPKSCQNLPRIHVSDLCIAPVPSHTNPRDIQTSQGLVYSTADGSVAYYFKPRLLGREAALEREISILAMIKNEAGLLSKCDEIRLSKLVGVVVTEMNDGPAEENTVVGMLLEWIPPSTMGSDLLSEGLWSQHHHDLHKKWYKQVTATVKSLHEHGIVWGDVNPGNIAIDSHLNAWVIDFGGLNNPEFVDDNNMETRDGDWQGVRRIFEEWLPNRNREVQSLPLSSPKLETDIHTPP